MTGIEGVVYLLQMPFSCDLSWHLLQSLQWPMQLGLSPCHWHLFSAPPVGHPRALIRHLDFSEFFSFIFELKLSMQQYIERQRWCIVVWHNKNVGKSTWYSQPQSCYEVEMLQHWENLTQMLLLGCSLKVCKQGSSEVIRGCTEWSWY